MNRIFCRARGLSIPLATLTLALCGAGVASVAGATPEPNSASSSIEGVWSFNGGAVDVVGQSNGTLIGVVTVNTKFAQCVHKVGEQIWTEMRRQPDGSYWGLHHWFFESSACVPNPTYGPTAWRVLANGHGESFVRVCFSEPASDKQPTIAPDGSTANVTYGCVDSASIAPLPSAPSGNGSNSAFKQAVILPPPACHHLKTLKIKLRDPKYDPLKRVVVWVNHRKVADVRGVQRLKRGITVKHLPAGAFTVQVLAITTLDYRLSGKRSYGRCAKGSGQVGLKGGKPGHHKGGKRN